jgi:hypothetical protein
VLGVPSAIAAIRWPDIARHPVEGSLLLAGLAVLFGLTGLVLSVPKTCATSADALRDAAGAVA